MVVFSYHMHSIGRNYLKISCGVVSEIIVQAMSFSFFVRLKSIGLFEFLEDLDNTWI
jgi:hypothetical protein